MKTPKAISKADIEEWYDTGNRTAGARVVEALAPRVALPASFGRALGSTVAEEVEQDALVRLLDRDRALLLEADDPLAFASTVARNLARDMLRRHRRRGDLADHRESVEEGSYPAPEREGAAIRLDAARALDLLNDLGDDSRIAVFLVHAPERMPASDWMLLQARQPSGLPCHPSGPLNREEASRLLWPPPVPETRLARRRRLERIRKVLSRAYSQLAVALGKR